MKRMIIIAAIAGLYSGPARAEFSAILDQEWVLDSHGRGETLEAVFEPEWSWDIGDNLAMTLIARARIGNSDSLGPRHDRPANYSAINGPLIGGSDGQLSVREWYLDAELWGAYWRVGKQQVVWGQADGLKVLDLLNPQSFREFILDDFEDSRIPLWMVNVEVSFGESDNLQILWIPDLTYNEFAEPGTTFEANSPVLVPILPSAVPFAGIKRSKPGNVLADSDVGFRYSRFHKGWDLTLNYLYHYHDSPVLYQSLGDAGIQLESVYERNHLIGATASNTFGDFTLRAELGYNSDTYNLSRDLENRGIHRSADLSLVLGLDWQGMSDTLISAQWFQSHLQNYTERVIRPRDNHIMSFLYRRMFQNEIWELEVLALHGFDQDDGLIQSSLSYQLRSDLKLRIGNDVFYGGQSGLFGQFDARDRWTLALEWGL